MVSGVTKRFGNVVALDHIMLKPKSGLNFVLGPNGAGKSTLLKVIAGLYRPDSGKVSVLGENPYANDKLKQVMSLLTDNYALYDFLTVRKNLEFFGRLYGIEGGKAISKVEEMLKALGIYELLDSKVEALSRGTKQKVAFCRAILSDPKILLLDEPTAFLDASASNIIRNYIVESVKGKDIIFVTQKLDEVARFNGAVHIMRKGRIVKSTSISGMYRNVLKGMVVNIRFARPVRFEMLKHLQGLQGVYPGLATMVHIKINNYKDISAAVDAIREKGIAIVGIDYIEPFIESIFR
ncbi:MAG: ABC transporter ATP-binding protein [Candidatus Marsarchaeota archaeon]|nr:ABC transporter ATP-binding protein [Candidatus Marsarchaeota archaeon]